MLSVSQEISEFLSERRIEYKRYSHKPIFTMEDGKEIAKYTGTDPCKTLLVVNRQYQYYMLLLKHDTRISLSQFAQIIGSSHLSFATSESLKFILHSTKGSVSPLGLIFDINKMVGLFIDKYLLQQEFIMVHPCTNNESFIFKSSDFFNRFLPSVNRENYHVI